MKYYILDDDIAMVDVLEDIIFDKNLGDVCGSQTDPIRAAEEIARRKPDIVLVDFMMSGMDGIKLIETVKAKLPETCFVMISKVTDKTIVRRAYDAGVEFFISKPISIIEVERVLGNVAERIRMKEMMDSIRSMFDNSHLAQPVYMGAGSGDGHGAFYEERHEARYEPHREEAPAANDTMDIDILLNELGILGESGANDIRLICGYADKNNQRYDKSLIGKVADDLGDSVSTVEQRVRRAIRKALTNAAMAGLEDIASDKFAVYANYVFDYSVLRDEMNYISKKTGSGGRISIPRFIEGLLLYNKMVQGDDSI